MNISIPYLLGFLGATAVSCAYGYWLGGYAKRHGWDRDFAKRRAGLAPYIAGLAASALFAVLRVQTGVAHSELMWTGLGFLWGGLIVLWIVLRRASL
jgi:hypothetical protein